MPRMRCLAWRSMRKAAASVRVGCWKCRAAAPAISNRPDVIRLVHPGSVSERGCGTAEAVPFHRRPGFNRCALRDRPPVSSRLYNRSVYSLYSLLLLLALIRQHALVAAADAAPRQIPHRTGASGWARFPTGSSTKSLPTRSGSTPSRWARCWPSRASSKN